MSTVKSFMIKYDTLNESGTFSEGDAVTGTVTLVLQKQVRVNHLYVKAKGEALAYWIVKTAGTHPYSTSERYFKLKHFLVGSEKSKDIIVPKGTHIYGFSFQIPRVSMPSSFKGTHGKIVYMVEAVLSRGCQVNRTVAEEIKFVTRSRPNITFVKSPQFASVTKEMGLFSQGNVQMEVRLDKSAYAPGDTVVVVAQINNSSSRDVTPKFCLKQQVIYKAEREFETHVIRNTVDECVRSNTQREVMCAIQIPPGQQPTIHNCGIIRVGYQVKVSLDISFACNPSVKLPVKIIPHELVRGPWILGPAKSARPRSNGVNGLSK